MKTEPYIYYSFMVMNPMFFYLSVIYSFMFCVQYVLASFQTCRFSGVICSSCIISMRTRYAPFIFTLPLELRSSMYFFANLIIRIISMSKTMSVRFSASALSLSLSREPGHGVPCKCRNGMSYINVCILMEDCFPDNQFSVRVNKASMGVTCLPSYLEVSRRTNSLLDVRGEPLDAQEINVEDTHVS